MREPLQQSAIDIASKPLVASSVSATALMSGIGNMFELLQPIIGGIASILAATLTFFIIRHYRKKWQLMEIEKDLMVKDSKLKDAQIAAIDERKKSREEPSC